MKIFALLILMSCSFPVKQKKIYGKPATFNDSNCLKWEMNECVHILNKDVIFLKED